MTEKKTWGGISSFTLHILAMALMLCDHLWATVVPGNAWLTWIGRIAFPIFAFMTAEGYHHTRNFKKYMLRLLACAIISEIPFNLMMGGSWIYPFHQNVLWTFLIAQGSIRIIENTWAKRKKWVAAILTVLILMATYLVGLLSMVDYHEWGVMTVLMFYFFRGPQLWKKAVQLVSLCLINWEFISGLTMPLTIGSFSFEMPQQGMAVLAIIPIWLYKGRQGHHSKTFRWICYLFYPVHIIVLALMM